MRLPVDDLQRLDGAQSLDFGNLGIRAFTGVSTDSRKVGPGHVFVAIPGERLDGHAYVPEAFARGAGCAVVEKQRYREEWRGKPVLLVEDSLRALGGIASLHRRKFTIPVIAVAGSNGKTTTKELIAAVLSTRHAVLSTQGNLNNHIGVPLTLFRLDRRHEIAVIEIGTNHFGELDYLCSILHPTHGLITNIGREHLEYFGDLAGVARAEGELFEALAPYGTGFINADDPEVVRLGRALRNRVTYGSRARGVAIRGIFEPADRQGRVGCMVHPRGKRPFRIQSALAGYHAAANALAAAAVGVSFGVPARDIRRALKNARPVAGRMEISKAGGVMIVNDSYNANPDSFVAALRAVRDMPRTGKTLLILADMLELGASAETEHARLGEMVSSMGFDCLLTFGPMGEHISRAATSGINVHYTEKNMLAEYAAELLMPGDLVLVKGSRGMHMEDVVAFLRERLQSRRKHRG